MIKTLQKAIMIKPLFKNINLKSKRNQLTKLQNTRKISTNILKKTKKEDFDNIDLKKLS